jgi:hypothetical protein
MDLKALEKRWSEAKQRTLGIPYMEPGTFDLKLVASKLVETRMGDVHFVNEFEVLKSTNEKFSTGDMVQVGFMLKYDAALADAKTFIACATQAPFDSVTPATLAAVTNPEKQPLKGTVLNNVAEDRPSAKTGKLYTRHRWRLVEPSPAFKGQK